MDYLDAKMADISHGSLSLLKRTNTNQNYLYFKKQVLNSLFRSFCFVNERNQISGIKKEELNKLAIYTKLSNLIVDTILNQFFTNAQNIKRFFTSKSISWEHDRVKLTRKLRIYLHKLHRIAPIFSYARAKENLNRLHLLLEQKNHWPHITTQIALVIFITDRNNKKLNENRYIIQKNLRAFCDCSAYAFHHARNVLCINTKGQAY